MSVHTKSAPHVHPVEAWQAKQQAFQYTNTLNGPMNRRGVSQKHIIVVSGPSGCGKSTVADHLSQELGVPFLEGDDYHPDINKLKMSYGVPLDDQDRWAWLETLRDEAIKLLHSSNIVLVACSALKRRYRDVFRTASCASIQVHFVYLVADEALLQARLEARQGHFMKDFMLRSQMETLEEPEKDEIDVVQIASRHNQESVSRIALERVWATLRESKPS